MLPSPDLPGGQADVAGADGGSEEPGRAQVRQQLQAAQVLRSEQVHRDQAVTFNPNPAIILVPSSGIL